MDRKAALASLGYTVKSEFYSGATKPFIVEIPNIAVAKIYNYDSYEKGRSYNHILRDSAALSRLQDIDTGIPRLYSAGESCFEGEPFAYCTREYLEGKDIINLSSIDKKTMDDLEDIVKKVHCLGIARLDMVTLDTISEDFNLLIHNIMISPKETVSLYDFGDCVFADEMPSSDFESHKKRDLNDLKYISGIVRT